MAPVLQEYVPLPKAVNVVDGLLQVRAKAGGETEAVGGVLFRVTEANADAVQPLDPVTVTVYVLADVTEMELVDAPVFHR